MWRVGDAVALDELVLVLEVVTTTEDELLLVLELVTTTEEDFDVEELVETILDELDLVLEVVGATLLLLVTREVSLYISSLFPAPQYS